MHEVIKTDRPMPFMQFAKPASVLSVLMVLLSICCIAIKGFNWGLDFTGGTVIELNFSQSVNLPQVREIFEQQGIQGAVVQHFGSSRDLLIRMAPQESTVADQIGQQVLQAAQKLDAQVTLKRLEFVGPAVGQELSEQGGLAVIAALLCILIYIGFRFEWRLSAGAVLALAHDVIITLGIFSLLDIEIDLTVLAAVLTVVGYSLNDTIVVFDRVRENFRKLRKATTIQVLDQSVTETLSRTLITSGTTLIVVIALFIKGGPLIHSFALALLIGISVGTYSSIYIASAFSLFLGLTREHMIEPEIKKEGEELNSLL